MMAALPPDAAIPCLAPRDLRRAGRSPATPFRVRGAGGEIITVLRLLRVLPGKRLAGEARRDGKIVLAKLFVGRGGERHWARERRGLALLRDAGLPTPETAGAGKLDGGGHFLLTGFLDDSRTPADLWSAMENPVPGDPEALDVLRPVFALAGRLHAAGLIQNDLHLGNFLEHEGALYLIDGDGVAHMRGGAEERARQALDNLALLIAQLPPAWAACDSGMDALLAAYTSNRECARAYPRPDPQVLRQAVERARARRLARFLDKTLRDCSQFAVRRTLRRFSSVGRDEEETLAALLDAPQVLDEAIARGALLKDGHTCTVARVDVGGRALIVKRYNLKNPRHALSRCWRPSRAWHAWLSGHRLAFLGIPTPAPLALIEERAGPLRRRAFLITEFCPGTSLLQRLSPEREPDADEAAAIMALFGALHRQRITHGDMKATNFLWQGKRLAIIDLDALAQHPSDAAFARGWQRDRARFLRNGPPDSALRRWLDTHLPEV
jgi:tRNA A-37 threonylcarbamoyl transferase component Bud32